MAAAQKDYEARLASVRQAEANNAKAQTDCSEIPGRWVQREEIFRTSSTTPSSPNAKTQFGRR